MAKKESNTSPEWAEMIASMGSQELQGLISAAQNALAAAEKRERKEAIAAARAVAAEYGFSLDQLYSEGSNAEKGKGLEPVYFNPDNPEQGWSGRGRQPKWYKELMEQGVDPETLKN